MKKILVPVLALMILAQAGISATLKPETKKTLKQMVQMNGRMQETCEDKDADHCLGSQVNKSDFATKSETEAKPSTIQAIDERQVSIQNLSGPCKAGDAKACKRLALISQEMNKPRTSIQLFKLACDYGDSGVCRGLAERLDKAGKKDLAALYLEKACRHGDQKSCASAAAKN